MQNENNRNKKALPYDKLEYQNVLFSVPLTRWERYCLALQRFREGSPKEVFFEPKDSRTSYDTEDSVPEIGQANRVYGENGHAPALNSWAPLIVGDPSRKRGLEEKDIFPTLRSEAHGNLPAINVLNKGESQHYRLYDTEGLAPTLQSQSGMSSQKHPFVVASRGRGENNKQQAEKRNDGLTNTITGVEKDNYVFDGKVRKLMPIECEALMSWPRDWTRWGIDEKGNKVEISDSQRYKMCGNGVVSNVVRELTNKLF